MAVEEIPPALSLVPNRERRGGMQSEFRRRPPRRVAFDWATRRKPLAGRTLWMLEPTLVRMEGRVDLQVRVHGGLLRAGARDAVRAGADSLEHATDMDDATIADMVQRKTWYVPTIDHNRYYVDNYKLLGYPAEAVDGLNDYIARNLATAKKAWRWQSGFTRT